MMRHSKMLAIVMIAFTMLSGFAQQTIKENDYTVVYEKSEIVLKFDHPNVFITNVFDVNKKVPIAFHQIGADFILANIAPATIIRVDYQVAGAAKNTYLASPSLSTGTMDVYFNHPVNTSYAQIQNAVNLADTLEDMLISYINSCQATLDIAIYNSASPSATTGLAGAINAAYNRGVQVRLIYDGSTNSSMIALLDSNIPKIASPNSSSYGIMHNKFVIFDANSSNPNLPYVWTGSTNWTAIQIDGPDKNSAIMIQDQALALGYKLEFEEMWGSTTMNPDLVASKFGPYKTDNTPHHYIIGGKTVNSYFSPSDGVNAKIIQAINSANTDIDIATMLITRSDISTTLTNKYNAGITNINIVTSTQNPSGNQFNILQAALLPNHVVKYSAGGLMHHKFMVVDNYNSTSDPLVLLGSHNWSTSAETRNDENTLIIHDLNIANQYYQAFAYLYLTAGGEVVLANPEFTANDFKLYPNPTSGEINIAASAPLHDAAVTVYDSLGKKVAFQQLSGVLNETISIGNQAAGLYFVSIQANGSTQSFKIIKE